MQNMRTDRLKPAHRVAALGLGQAGEVVRKRILHRTCVARIGNGSETALHNISYTWYDLIRT